MKEQLSALMDGEEEMDTSPHLYTALRKSDEARECWATWHAIGDVMRGEYDEQPGLQDRIMQQLEAEPTILAPKGRLQRWLDSSFAVPVAATAAAIFFVGWVVWQPGTNHTQNPTQPSIAQIEIPAESLNSYMLAHHEYAPSNGMQHAYNLQPATFTEPGN